MTYRTPAEKPMPVERRSIDQIVQELPLIDRTQAKINLAVADLRDECSDLYEEAFDRFFPGAEFFKAIGRTFGGSMAYSRACGRREMVESDLREKYDSNLK